MLAQTLRQSALTGHIGIVDAVAGLGGTLAEGEILQLSHVEQESFSEETYFSIIIAKPVHFSRPAVNLRRFLCVLKRISSVVRAN